MFKCIEQNTPCIHKEHYGSSWYCNLGHAPNHVWTKNAEGQITMDKDHCAEDKYIAQSKEGKANFPIQNSKKRD